MSTSTSSELTAADKAIVRAELTAQALGGAWVNYSGDGLAVYLDTESADDLSMMLAAGRIEKALKRDTKVVTINCLTPAERLAMRDLSIRI